MQQKKASATSDEPSTPRKSNCPGYGVKHYAAVRPLGEDDTSIARFKEAMLREDRKKNKDYRTIDLAMERTFGDRRTWIINNNPTTITIKEEYPCLFTGPQVI
jgi:hypothetical protein